VSLDWFARASLAAVLVSLSLHGVPAGAASDAATLASLPRLVDQRGLAVGARELRGSPVFVTFVATRCSDACPIATALFGKIRERLQRRGMRATLLEVTLDPTHDTPFAMSRYAQAYGAAGASDWRFASGSPAAVRAWMRAFGVSTSFGSDGVPDEHSSFVYLFDARGTGRQTFVLSSSLVDQAVQRVTQIDAL
jgi:protein SCO1/2